MATFDGRRLVRESFDAAVAAADPLGATPFIADHLPERPKGRAVVVGGGKAAASMALAVERAWPDVSMSGIVVTRDGHGSPTTRIDVVEVGDPITDEAGEDAVARMLELVAGLGPDDVLLVLLSGGGSRLLSSPAPGLSTDHLRLLDRALRTSGAPFAAIERRSQALLVDRRRPARRGRRAPWRGRRRADRLGRHRRRPGGDRVGSVRARSEHLSRRARHRRAPSGRPAVRDPQSPAARHGRFDRRDAEARRSGLRARRQPRRRDGACEPRSGRRLLSPPGHRGRDPRRYRDRRGPRGREGPCGTRPRGPLSRSAVVDAGRADLRRRMRGHAGAGESAREKKPPRPRGGRCTEFLLSLALELDGQERTFALACDTDGVDGSEDNAGADARPRHAGTPRRRRGSTRARSSMRTTLGPASTRSTNSW